MHCPNCGSEAPLTQKFCRSCGLSLEKIPQVVAAQFSRSESDVLSDRETEKLQRRQRSIERLLSTAGLGFVGIAVISMLAGISYLMIAGSLPLVPGVVILIMLIVGLIAAFLGLYSEKLKRTLSESSSVNSAPLSSKSITTELPVQTSPDASISVTEHTTKLLE
jgi:ABC-type transport system involved in cytochrome bd biosynthesis fused ATPase/permease subunit